MDEWVAWAKGQVPPHAKQHTVTALCGLPGSGKSGGGLLLFRDVQASPFNVKEQVYFRPSERVHIARRLGVGKVVYGDESSGEGGHKRRAMATANVDNVMDLDIMRQRHQHTVFTSPEFDHLDPAIQEACQWVHSFGKDHVVTSYEMIHSGKPGNRFHYPKERFTTPDFPHAEVAAPDMWGALMALKMDYLAGTDVKGAARALAWELKAEAIMSAVLQSSKRMPE